MRALLIALFIAAPALGQTLSNSEPLPRPWGPTRRTILVTGYWPPTNEMLRPFSPNPAQNPGSWIGSNWENRGYDIRAYFPEFPGGTGSNPRGTGDFEVDYQDTAADLSRLIEELRPVAVVSFSRANTSIGWEMEPAYQRHRLPGETQLPGRSIPIYSQDYFGNRYPTEALAGIPIGDVRLSTLPMTQIRDAVAAAIPSSQINPFIPNYNPATPDTFDYGGAFLSGYLPYLAARYRDMNNNPADPFRMVMSGHVHVGTNLNVSVGTQATMITLREVTTALDVFIGVAPSPGGVGLLGLAGVVAGRRRR
jgi:MYXO-CTERM domain-containing protein